MDGFGRLTLFNGRFTATAIRNTGEITADKVKGTFTQFTTPAIDPKIEELQMGTFFGYEAITGFNPMSCTITTNNIAGAYSALIGRDVTLKVTGIRDNINEDFDSTERFNGAGIVFTAFGQLYIPSSTLDNSTRSASTMDIMIRIKQWTVETRLTNGTLEKELFIDVLNNKWEQRNADGTITDRLTTFRTVLG